MQIASKFFERSRHPLAFGYADTESAIVCSREKNSPTRVPTRRSIRACNSNDQNEVVRIELVASSLLFQHRDGAKITIGIARPRHRRPMDESPG
jgi:hypothetical protein